jgi:hypothetical protein
VPAYAARDELQLDPRRIRAETGADRRGPGLVVHVRHALGGLAHEAIIETGSAAANEMRASFACAARMSGWPSGAAPPQADAMRQGPGPARLPQPVRLRGRNVDFWVVLFDAFV